MEEIWKDIEGYEGFFQVSNIGRIKSLERYCEQYNGRAYIRRTIREKIRKQTLTPKGYLLVSLSDGSKRKSYMVHRLVAEAFIPNPDNKEQINHIDGNKKNNNLTNLEWCTQNENMKHAYKMGLKQPMTGKNNYSSKEVIQYDLNMNEIARYGSAGEAARKNNTTISSITRCCREEGKEHKGFIWKYN